MDSHDEEIKFLEEKMVNANQSCLFNAHCKIYADAKYRTVGDLLK